MAPASTAAGDSTSPDAPLIMELHRLAMLVYLDRASENLLNKRTKTQQLIDKAFAIFARLDRCVPQFPVFVLGCEARSDEQRAAVLGLISRTEADASSRSFNYARSLVQAVWAQDDLAEGEIRYWDKLTYVISCCKIVPTFV